MGLKAAYNEFSKYIVISQQICLSRWTVLISDIVTSAKLIGLEYHIFSSYFIQLNRFLNSPYNTYVSFNIAVHTNCEIIIIFLFPIGSWRLFSVFTVEYPSSKRRGLLLLRTVLCRWSVLKFYGDRLIFPSKPPHLRTHFFQQIRFRL